MNVRPHGRGYGARALAALLALLAVLATWAALPPADATAQEGRVKGWGANDNYQLGGTLTTAKYKPVTIPGATGSDIDSLAAGYYHSLSLLSNGTVESWGRNAEGQLGIGSTAAQEQASTVTGLRGVVAVAAGNHHSLALLADGTVRAWGRNSEGQLGDNTTAQRNTPVTVAGLTNVEAISAGALHSIAVLSDGTVKTWGYNAQ
ncbi:RCC1 domain-containing protein, partial [Streptomyces jumonjinensis]|uniref:RCC1 domain-containing protein n=1 Tax=Streptomyces jumonjinensis TaxID=1945 RepID=UPI00389A8967